MPIRLAAVVPHPPIILPEIGQGQEREIRATGAAYRELARRIRQLNPDTMVILSSHATSYADYFHISPGGRARGDLKRFGASQVQVNCVYDEEFVCALEQNAKRAGLPAGTKGEREKTLDHGTLIPLTFFAEKELHCEVVRIGLSGLDAAAHYLLGKCIKKTAEELKRDVVVVASGDLSHKLLESGPYGYTASGPEFDRQATAAMAGGDFFSLLTLDATLCEEAAECGLGTFWILAGTLDRMAVKSELISYEGPFGVGYAVAAFTPEGADESRAFDVMMQKAERARIGAIRAKEDAFVRLARQTVEAFVRGGEEPALPDDLPEEMTNRRAGVFVSLKLNGKLRGCIGTTAETKGCIAEEILNNAISACSEDPRFPPVSAGELARMVYSVDVLGATERIESAEQLDVKRYGVIVISGFRKGLLLPNLEGVDTVEDQIQIAKRKAGIPVEERCRMERFEVVRHT
ncbi:MAG: AmmeMemoRadiSam system protein A [Christensenella sp.]|nr:AmmeMemoRadiSam system protein A [Christensenella sp.]